MGNGKIQSWHLFIKEFVISFAFFGSVYAPDSDFKSRSCEGVSVDDLLEN